MNEAIGSEISDYLLKPLNPNQLLISVKRILENSLIIQNKLKSDYVSFVNELSDMIKNNNFPSNSTILAVHTGGLQGIEGMNQRLQSKEWKID